LDLFIYLVIFIFGFYFGRLFPKSEKNKQSNNKISSFDKIKKPKDLLQYLARKYPKECKDNIIKIEQALYNKRSIDFKSIKNLCKDKIEKI